MKPRGVSHVYSHIFYVTNPRRGDPSGTVNCQGKQFWAGKRWVSNGRWSLGYRVPSSPAPASRAHPAAGSGLPSAPRPTKGHHCPDASLEQTPRASGCSTAVRVKFNSSHPGPDVAHVCTGAALGPLCVCAWGGRSHLSPFLKSRGHAYSFHICKLGANLCSRGSCEAITRKCPKVPDAQVPPQRRRDAVVTPPVALNPFTLCPTLTHGRQGGDCIPSPRPSFLSLPKAGPPIHAPWCRLGPSSQNGVPDPSTSITWDQVRNAVLGRHPRLTASETLGAGPGVRGPLSLRSPGVKAR